MCLCRGSASHAVFGPDSPCFSIEHDSLVCVDAVEKRAPVLIDAAIAFLAIFGVNERDEIDPKGP